MFYLGALGGKVLVEEVEWHLVIRLVHVVVVLLHLELVATHVDQLVAKGLDNVPWSPQQQRPSSSKHTHEGGEQCKGTKKAVSQSALFIDFFSHLVASIDNLLVF